MSKFFGKVGYIVSEITAPGVYSEVEEIVDYYGDYIKMGSRWRSSDKINDDTTITSQISIVADPFAFENFSNIRWVEYMGIKWKVESAQPERPRIILNLGGVYNGVSGSSISSTGA